MIRPVSLSRIKAERIYRAGPVADFRWDEWLVRRWSTALRTWEPVAYVEKWRPEPGVTHPFKVFVPIVGQGPIHRGEMVRVDYEAGSAEQAVCNAYRDGELAR